MRFKNLEPLAEVENCRPLQLLKRATDSEELVDLRPLCPQFRNAAEKSELFCGGCEIPRISFHTFVMNEALHKLESQLEFFEKLMRRLAALAVMRSVLREITNLHEMIESQFCDLDLRVLQTRYGRKFHFVKRRYLALMPFLRHHCTAPLTHLEALWQSCLATSFDDVEAPAQLFRSIESPERQRRLCSAVKDVATEFNMIPKVDLISQVFMVMDCLLQISRISADFHVVKQILKYLLKLCNRVGIITTVTVMSAVFMLDNEFRKLCSHDELAAWSLFEGVVLTLMAKDEALSRLAVSLRDNILNQNSALSRGDFFGEYMSTIALDRSAVFS
jgi:hypothetical protein